MLAIIKDINIRKNTLLVECYPKLFFFRIFNLYVGTIIYMSLIFTRTMFLLHFVLLRKNDL